MRKILATILLVFFVLTSLFGCGSEKVAQNSADKIKIVCTTLPVYDWITEIIGEKAEGFSVTLLGNGNSDLHSFQPSAKDMSLIYQCDLLVGIGGVTEEWLDKIDKQSGTEKVLLLETLNSDDFIVPEVETEEHNHAHHRNDEYDEHIWLSLRLAEKMVNSICKDISKLDEKNGVIYKLNAANYCEKLSALDAQFEMAAELSKNNTVIFADRFPFAYMMRDYGIDTVAAFSGCSADIDSSFEAVAKLCEAVKLNKKTTLLVLENSDRSIAKAVGGAIGEVKINLAVMNSCQTLENGTKETFDYIEIMKRNLESLKMALD